jgi:hypothetical protein
MLHHRRVKIDQVYYIVGLCMKYCNFIFWLSAAQAPLQGGEKVNSDFGESIFKGSASLDASSFQIEFFRVR